MLIQFVTDEIKDSIIGKKTNVSVIVDDELDIKIHVIVMTFVHDVDENNCFFDCVAPDLTKFVVVLDRQILEQYKKIVDAKLINQFIQKQLNVDIDGIVESDDEIR